MTDPELLAKKLAAVETHVREARELGRPDALEHDLKEQRFVLMTLQLAVQAALDVASQIVSARRLGEPRRHRELFELLERGDWISADLSARLQKMAGFRNLLVHQYALVDLDVVRDVLVRRLDDLLDFVAAVRTRLAP